MNKKLSLWWEQVPSRSYVARRDLIEAVGHELAPFENLVVYYCGGNFTPQRITALHSQIPTFAYLINGEKEPPDAQEDSPWASGTGKLIGGALRQEAPEIIPVLYIVANVKGKESSEWREYTSDQVPLVQKTNSTVRVIAGQFENAIHPLMEDRDVMLLDIVLAQGGELTCTVPPGCQAFAYVTSGVVNFGKKDTLANRSTDTLVAIKGSKLYVSSQCAGGRLLLITTRATSSKRSTQEVYENVVLSQLDQVKNA